MGFLVCGKCSHNFHLLIVCDNARQILLSVIYKPNGRTLGDHLGFRVAINLIYPVTATFEKVSGAKSPKSTGELCARTNEMPAMLQNDAIRCEGLRILRLRLGEKPARFDTEDSA
jgi:hypothetical protein